ncbi:MAG: molybdenum cofactor biosynthesis protein MoaB [Bacteroidetes bacterium]|nr:molybdenum cofactor biosynthesis protein MoaB [Bacteroidota bacterium]
MSASLHELNAATQKARISVITCSDTRTINSDTSGAFIVDTIKTAGHELVSYVITPDDSALLARAIIQAKKERADLILINGGTGISKRDNTFDTLSRMIESPLPGYGELFRYLSFKEIGASAMLSRAQAGRMGDTFIFSMPGSTSAVHLAMTTLILPQIGHIVQETRK